MKVACVTCYIDPDYVRSRAIRAGLAANPDVELLVVKNTARGALRYGQVAWRLLKVSRAERPDVYWLNFRGYELLPFVLLVALLAGRKPVVYDEFINPVLVVEEHRRNKQGVVKMLMGVWPLFGRAYYSLAKRAAVILTDTPAHGRYSANHGKLPADKYHAVPVGTDETVFYPKPTTPAKPFQVFFYSPGSQPLHGMPVIMEAAVTLKDRHDIEFLVAGSKGGTAGLVASAVDEGARIRHEHWIDFDELPNVIRASGVCLGGPFGGTPQAQVVVTGKTYQFMACQVPVIVGASPAMADFTDKKNSLVVSQADAAALAQAIAWLADHPKERQAIARAGRALYEKKYSTQAIAGDLAAVLRALPR